MATQHCVWPQRLRTKGRGMALVMVVSVVGVAAVLGYALLAATSLQAQAGGNASRAASAEYLADSGLQLAIWNLQNSNGAWNGQSGISLGSSVNGTVAVSVQSLAGYNYQVTSTATVNGLSRTAQAQIQLMTPTTICSASGNPFNQVSAALTNTGILGTVTYQSPAPAVSPANLTNSTWLSTNAVQLPCNLNNAVYGPADSPSGVFLLDGSSTITNTVIRGTLVVNGDLTINGNSNRITATANQPALVITGDLRPGGGSAAEIDGGLWIGDGVGPSMGGLGSLIKVNGPLTVGNGGVALFYLGQIRVRPLAKIISWNPAAPGS